MTTLNIRIDEKLKKSAQMIFKEQGTDISSAVRVFLYNSVKEKIEKELEEEIKRENVFFKTQKGKNLLKKWNSESKKSLQEKKSYNNADDLFIDILGKNYV